MAQLLCNNAFDIELPKTPEELIDWAIREDRIGSLYIIVPTGKLERRLKHYLIRGYFALHHKPVEEPNLFTFSSFVQFCYGKICSYVNQSELNKILQTSDAYRLALIEEASEKAGLKFFVQENKRISPVILQNLANVIFGLKEDGISVDKLYEDIQQTDDKEDELFDLDRLTDVCKLYESYQNILGDKYLDYPEVLTNTIAYLRNTENSQLSISKLFNDDAIVLMHGFSEFKQPELEFISLFASSDVPYGLHLDFSTANGPLFGNISQNIEKIKDIGFKLYAIEDSNQSKVLYESLSEKTDSELLRSEYLRKWLFKAEYDLTNKDFRSIIKIISTENRGDEVVFIAKLVKYHILEKGIKPYRICIAMRQPNLYSKLFREVFSSYKIPVNISDRFALDESPVTVAIMSILNIILYGYKREDVQKAMKSRLLTFKNSKGSTIDTENLSNKSLQLRILGGYIRGGARYWERILTNRIRFIKKRINDIELSDEKDAFYKNIIIELEDTKKALNDFIIINEMIAKKKKLYSPIEFSELVNDEIILNFDIRNNIIELYESLNTLRDDTSELERNLYEEGIEKDAKALASIISIIGELAYITTDRFPDTKFTLEELVHRFKTTISAEKYQIREKQQFGVEITSIEQTRGIPYDIMILCGALDGEFPFSYKPETFLGKELVDSEDRHIQSERLLFYQFLTNKYEELNKGNKQVFISYPRNNETEELVRSPFIDAILKITSLKENENIFDVSFFDKESKSSEQEEIYEQNQLEQLPWLNMVANDNEFFSLSANIEIQKNNKSDEGIIGKYNCIVQSYGYESSVDYIKHFYESTKDEKGVIDFSSLPEEIVEALSGRASEPVSISDLETYAKCPYQYFLKKIIRIKEPEILDLSLSQIDKGNLLHTILYRFYSTVQQKMIIDDDCKELFYSTLNNNMAPIALVELKAKDKPHYKKLLHKIAEEELELIRFDHPFFNIEQEKILGNDSMPGLIDVWLETEFERISKNWQYNPALFELEFGINKYSRISSTIEAIELAPDLILKGKIDRVEFLKSQNSQAWSLIIADYKINIKNVANNNDIRDGISFQVPLYLAAAKELLSKYYGIDVTIDGGVYYGLQADYDKKVDKKINEKFVLITSENHLKDSYSLKSSLSILKKDENIEELVKISIDYASTIMRSISNGEFPINPINDGSCKYCSYLAICRINERKV